MKKRNSNLHKARKNKNDEFYTQLPDIENELKHYRKHFKGKTVFCNCDDPIDSGFYTYFVLNFAFLGLKKLICTHFDSKKPSYKLEITGNVSYSKVKEPKVVKTPLKQNGDFRSPECIELLKKADIVVTNPPFSLFREYVDQLIKYDKKFLIIGNQNAYTYKDIFKLIKDNNIWIGYTHPKSFKRPNGSVKKFGNICWFTNLKIGKQNEELILYKTYKDNEEYYPKYDNYDIINVNRIKDIPADYNGVMGVPITFMGVYSKSQFEILGMANSARWIDYKCITVIDGNKIYNRVLIRKTHKT